MIEQLYFSNFDEVYKYRHDHKFKIGIPYIIYFCSHGQEKTLYAVGVSWRSSLNTDDIYVSYYSKEKWFEKLSTQDKQEAVWLMHD